MHTASIKEQVAALDKEARLDLLRYILEIEEQDELDSVWDSEIRKRIELMKQGEIKADRWENVKRRIGI